MWIFKDLITLHKLGRQELDRIDVKSRLNAAQSAMDQLNAEMGGMQINGAFVAADDPKRVSANATVMAARQTGAVINQNPLVDLSLMVMLPNGVPLPVMTAVVVALVRLPQVQAGSRLRVSLNPAVPSSIHIEWN